MWDDVVKRIAILKSLDNNCTMTYSEHHRYEFNPPVSLEYMEELEKNLGVIFPIELRTFYLEVGNGGAGPDSGLHRIEDLEAYRPHEDWPGVEYIDAAEDDGDEDVDNRVAGAMAIMDRFYSYQNLIVMNGKDAGKIIAFIPWDTICFESDSLIKVYNTWLDRRIGYFSWIKGLVVSGDTIQEIVQAMWDSERRVSPENALTHIASLLNFPFSYFPDALDARSFDRSTEGIERVVIDAATCHLFNEKLEKYRAEHTSNIFRTAWKFIRG